MTMLSSWLAVAILDQKNIVIMSKMIIANQLSTVGSCKHSNLLIACVEIPISNN